ncbi:MULTISPECIES: S8 family serine peptidase [unclassified Kribbella]|uniref:S8 family serine peptidase n=1 Tax=unclassified Kribbella TaxID=2644121 RepID=UPI0030189A68
MSFRPAHLLRLGLPAAMVAATLVAVTGSSGSAEVSAEPRPFKAPRPERGNGPAYDAKSVVVKFKPKATTSARKAALAKVKGKSDVSVTSDIVAITAELAAPDLLKKVKADPAVELASLNYIRQKSATPNDYLYTNYQKYLPTVRVNQAWDLSKSAGNQVVAVLDTGVDAGHPDLAGHLLPGYNTFNTALPPNDGDGHGTAVTGIIAAGTSNTIGIAGVAWNAKVRPVKVLDDEGSGTDANVINGINWAVKNGARVINLSLGSDEDSPVLHSAITSAVAKGVVVVAAAGNTGYSAPHYPAAYPEVLSVGATNWYGALTEFSTYGDTVDIAAPGFDITSTAPRAQTPAGFDPYYIGLGGTSFSSPIVAGVAALVRNKYPSFTPAQVMTRLKATARDAGPRGIDQYYGAGILDAYGALGGKWTTDFPGGGADGNDQPSRATPVAGSISSTISTEGDVDWYVVNSAAARNLKISVTGPAYDLDLPVNIGPRVDVYDADLKPLAYAVNPFPTNPSVPVPLTATANVSVAAGNTYIAVRNDNGSRDTRSYQLSVSEEGTGGTPAGVAYPVRDVLPADRAAGAAVTTKPSVTFAREVVADSVTASTVRLLNGKTGSTVGATVAYDAATKQAVLTPTVPLLDNAPYKVVVSGVQEASGTALAPFSSVFSTVDLVPAKPVFDATGAFAAATLAWQIAPMSDLDQVIVRRNVGSKAPTLTTGTLVYAGTGSSVKNTGLAQGLTYTFAAWVKDRSGKVSPVAVTQLFGMKSGIALTTTLIKYGGSVTIKGSLLRIDNKAYSGLPVNLYVRPKNVSTWKLLATLKTSSYGTVSYTYKPAVSSVFTISYFGNADLMGTRTADVMTQVTPTISATLAPTTIRLGQVTKFSGYVAPAHSGKYVYLQQYGNKTWKSIAWVKLSSSGAYAFGIKPAVRGKIAYRVWFPGDADHTQAFTVNKILTIS